MKKNSVPIVVVPSDGEITQQQSITLVNSTSSTIVNSSLVLASAGGSENCVLLDVSNTLLSRQRTYEEEDAASILRKEKPDEIRSNYVYQILNSSYEGNFQIASYIFELNKENKKKLLETKKTTYFSKNKVARLVVQHEFYRTNSLDISSERFLLLAKLCAELFSALLPESFYSKATATKSAGGALQLAYGKLREKEIAIGRLEVHNKRKFNDEDVECEALKILQQVKKVKAILTANTPFISDEHQITTALVVLPYLFKRSARVTSRSKCSTNWTPQYTEVLNSFIIHLKTNEPLLESLKEEEKKLLDLYNSHKLILRPFIIIKGSTLKEIESTFVIAGSIKYQVSSASLAVDVAFQLHKVLHEPFSVICNNVWQFLEKEIHDFPVNNMFASVASLIEKIRSL